MNRLTPYLFLTLAAGLTQSLEAARSDLFDAQFVKHENFYAENTTLVDFPVRQRSQMYADVMLPQAPVIHPYNIQDNLRPGRINPIFSFNIQFPNDYIEALPPSILAKLAEQKIPHENVSIFCVIQDQPWAVTAGMAPGTPSMAFRPHTFADLMAPAEGHYNQVYSVNVGVFEAPAGLGFFGHPENDFFASRVHVHGPGLVRASPNNLWLSGLDYRISNGFWTLAQSGQRTAATLHLVLNDADQAAMMALIPRVASLRELVTALDSEGSGLRGNVTLAKFKQLTRPIIKTVSIPDAASSSSSSSSSSSRPVGMRLLGSGFKGTTEVSVAGQVISKFMVVDDTSLLVAIPPELAGSRAIRITTPMGESVTPQAEPVLPPLASASPANLWLGEEAKAMIVPGTRLLMERRMVACAPGDAFIGHCDAQTMDMTEGHVRLGIRFDSDTEQGLGWEIPLPSSLPNASFSEDWVHLGVGGIAPPGATKAVFYLQAAPCSAGARVAYKAMTFRKAAGTSLIPAP